MCEKFAENPGFRVGNFAVNLERVISHVKKQRHETFPSPVQLLAHTGRWKKGEYNTQIFPKSVRCGFKWANNHNKCVHASMQLAGLSPKPCPLRLYYISHPDETQFPLPDKSGMSYQDAQRP